MKFNTLLYSIIFTSSGVLGSYYSNTTSVVTEYDIVSSFVTYCPEATTINFNEKTYVITSPTTLTITDCPCTIPKTTTLHSSILETTSSTTVTSEHITSRSIKQKTTFSYTSTIPWHSTLNNGSTIICSSSILSTVPPYYPTSKEVTVPHNSTVKPSSAKSTPSPYYPTSKEVTIPHNSTVKPSSVKSTPSPYYPTSKEVTVPYNSTVKPSSAKSTPSPYYPTSKEVTVPHNSTVKPSSAKSTPSPHYPTSKEVTVPHNSTVKPSSAKSTPSPHYPTSKEVTVPYNSTVKPSSAKSTPSPYYPTKTKVKVPHNSMAGPSFVESTPSPYYPISTTNETHTKIYTLVTSIEVVSQVITYCPSATTFITNGGIYTVTGPTYLTITDCPCTIEHVFNTTTSDGHTSYYSSQSTIDHEFITSYSTQGTASGFELSPKTEDVPTYAGAIKNQDTRMISFVGIFAIISSFLI